MEKLMRSVLLLCSALALAANVALPASAATVTLSAQSSTSVYGGNGRAGATIHETTLLPAGKKVVAGGFALSGDLDGVGAVENFTAWCVDITTRLRLPSTYTATTTPFSSGALSALQISNIERLFETGYKTLDLAKKAKAAGFQLALWEVLYEQSGAFDLVAGNFSASNSKGAIAAAQALLAGMNGPITQDYDMTFLQSNDGRNKVDGHFSQHLITVSAVPLPAGGLLLLAGIGALAALRRRKAKIAA